MPLLFNLLLTVYFAFLCLVCSSRVFLSLQNKDLDKALLPSKMKDDKASRAGSRAKPSIEDKMAVEEHSEGHDGFEKAKKMSSLLAASLQKMQQTLVDSKKAKYQPEAKLKKDYVASIAELEKLTKQLDKIVMEKYAQTLLKPFLLLT